MLCRAERERGPFSKRTVPAYLVRQVIDSGVYRVVRHPMYAAFPPIIVGASLWLESYAAIAVAALPLEAIAVRILFEEAFLRRERPGYAEYMRRVRWRVVPGVW
ncbi:MAG TPA: methyltransferase [Gemmataceae bacterium]|nr:methyltransferase [Gemmataceae bacterium]